MEEITKTENISDAEEIIRNLPKVENMTSERGNDIPNQCIIRGRGFTLFQSYDSPIALNLRGQIYIFPDWDYSVTTGKYRNQFLNETKAETESKIKAGVYIYIDHADYDKVLENA